MRISWCARSGELFRGIFILLLAGGFAPPLRSAPRRAAAAAAPTRPLIVGVSHIGVNTDDLAAARRYYTGVLGLADAFSLDDSSS